MHTCPFIRKFHKCLEIDIIVQLSQKFHKKNAMSQSPCFDIDYSGSYTDHAFLSKQLQLIKINSYHYCITLLNAIVQKTKPVAPLSTPFILTIHMLVVSIN